MCWSSLKKYCPDKSLQYFNTNTLKRSLNPNIPLTLNDCTHSLHRPTILQNILIKMFLQFQKLESFSNSGIFFARQWNPEEEEQEEESSRPLYGQKQVSLLDLT